MGGFEMSKENTAFNNVLAIEINLEKPFFHKLCANDQVYCFKMPFLTEEEIQTGKCERIQTIQELESFIREVKTVDEQESLLYELVKRLRNFPDLSELKSMKIHIENNKGGSINNLTLDYNFLTHKVLLAG